MPPSTLCVQPELCSEYRRLKRGKDQSRKHKQVVAWYFGFRRLEPLRYVVLDDIAQEFARRFGRPQILFGEILEDGNRYGLAIARE